MSNITINEDYILPSLGKIYGTPFDPHIKLRSMTVAEEMKRLSPTENPYKNMADIIENCLETKLPISVSDLCVGDYQFLLHKLRVVTYGPEYLMSIRCPICGEVFDYKLDLDSLLVNYFDESIDKLLEVKLPTLGKTIKLNFQSPKVLDKIEKDRKTLRKQNPNEDPTKLLEAKSMIVSIDNKAPDLGDIDDFIKTMPAKDYLILENAMRKLNEKVGIENRFLTHCPECGEEIVSYFRFTSEFFRPSID